MALPIVKRFLISLDENKFYGFLAFLLILGISVVVAIQPEKEVKTTYKAIGRLSFNSPPPTFTSTGQELQIQGQAVNLNILLSPTVLEKVANRLQFNNQQMQEILKKKFSIANPEEGAKNETTQLITLEYKEDKDPGQAKQVLDVFMEEMVNESYRINTAQLQSRIQNLEQRLASVQQELTKVEEKFYTYITTEGATLLSIQDGSLFGSITSSQQQQRELKVVLAGISAEIKTLEKQLGLNPKQAYTSAALSADPIIANIRALILQNEIDLDLLKKDLRPEHPRIVELRKQQKVNEKLLEDRAKEVVGNDGVFEPLSDKIRKQSNLDPARLDLAARLVALQSQREATQRQLESVTNIEKNLRREYELSPDKQIKQTELIQQVQSQRILYQTIFAALMDAKSAEAETGSSLAIAQPAFVPPPPPTPKPLLSRDLIILGGVGFGSVAFLGLIFLLATLDDRLHTAEELREALGERSVPFLGELPVIRALSPSGERIPIILDTNSGYLSFYERFRSNIRRLTTDSTKVILMISVNNEEGKSVSAYNLAIASAHAGKRTLLVEADLRTRNLASRKYFNIQPLTESLSNPVSYYDLRNDSISLVPQIENLYILPSIGFQQQASAIIESNEMQRFLKDVRSRYDLVIIDTPSLYRCNDALLLEPFADGIVLVTRPGVTLRSLLAETIDEFMEAELPLIGAVINDVEKLTPLPEFSAQSDFAFPVEKEESEGIKN